MMANIERRFSKDLFVTSTRMNNYYKKREMLMYPTINDKVSCLYLVDLGSVNTLYDSMNISKDKYPDNQYGDYRIGKFGLTKDISTRLNQHMNRKNGYGKISDCVQLRWVALMSPFHLSKAEAILSSLLKANDFHFTYSDNDRSHNELIIFHPDKENKVRKLFKQVLSSFPSKEDELLRAMDDNQKKYDMQLIIKDYEIKLKEEELKSTRAMYELEIYKLKLQILKTEQSK